MGFCSRRYFFFSICILQMISVIESQVFDFLGFLWIPILLNFFEIISVILGFFGAYQYRPKYIITYTVWHLFWLAWNVFVICLYLDIGDLDHTTNPVLKLDPSSESWWSTEGPGCKEIVPLHAETEQRNVENCLVNYIHVEIFQAGLQCFLGLFGIIIGACLCRAFLEEDDTFDYEDAKGAEHLFLQPMYVSSSDNLNHYSHFSKASSTINNKSGSKSHYASRIKYHRQINGSDAIRFPMRKTSSFTSFNKSDIQKRQNRPKSCADSSFFDD